MKEFGLDLFLVLLSTVSVYYVCFSETLRESFNRKRWCHRVDDVIEFVTSQHGNVT